MAVSHAQPSTGNPLPRIQPKWAYISAVVPLVAILLFVTVRPVLVLPRIRLAPGYVLTNQAGERVSHEDRRGHLVIYQIAYTQCGDACADSWATMAHLQDELVELESEVPVDLVTISVDTQRDTPEAMLRFANQNGIDRTRWSLLTGDAEQMKYVVGGGFNTYYTEMPDGSLYLEPSFMIVDGLGILRAEYRAETPTVATVLRDLELLLTEARNSEGVTRYAYEAAHLFLCYP